MKNSLQSNSQKDLNKGENKPKYMGNIEKGIGILFIIFGIIILISALPQQTPSILDLRIIKLNIGTQLDLIRLVLGGLSIFAGYKMSKEN